MAVQSFVKGDDLKKLIDDKLINAQSVKYVLRQKGILPVCTNSEALSDLIHHHFFGSATMTQMQEVMNFEQNNLKSTVVIISPKSEQSKEEVGEEEKEAFQKKADDLTEIFRKELGNDKLEVKTEKLKDDKVAAMAVLSEHSRRMGEMMKMYGMAGMDPSLYGNEVTLVLNANHPLVQFVTEHKRSKNVPIICKQLYDLAMLAHKPLNPEEMTAFVQRSNEIMMLLTK